MLTKADATKVGVPPYIRDRYVIRCTDARFAPSRAGNPMITLNWEVVGVPNDATNSTDPDVERQGTKWTIAGLKTNPTYMTLIQGGAFTRFLEFMEKAELEVPDPFDETNPDITVFNGLLMEAILGSEESVARKEVTVEERAEGKTIGDPILDKDGNKVTTTRVTVGQFLNRYHGSVGSNAF